MPEPRKVLFVCTGNSVRSQMAEGLMKALGGMQWAVSSAGVLPSSVHPLAVRVMEEIGIDISGQTSKSLDLFLGQSFDYVITLCDHASVTCPAFPGKGSRVHWSIEDPSSPPAGTEEKLSAFRRVRDDIRTRIGRFLKAESP